MSGHGGAREGAGAKPKAPTDRGVKLGVWLSAADARRLDAALLPGESRAVGLRRLALTQALEIRVEVPDA